MDTIPHRELRNNSSAVLARVEAGESIAVTNHGKVAALLVPPSATELERLSAAGAVREARTRQPDFHQIPRTDELTSREVLDDLRADR